MVMGTFDQDLAASYVLAFPGVYREGIRGILFSNERFWIFMIDAFYQSIICFFIPYAAYDDTLVNNTGYAPDKSEIGTVMAAGAIINANLVVALNNTSHTMLFHALLFLSNFLFFIWVVIYSYVPTSPISGLSPILYGSPNFYFILGMVTALCHLPRATYRYYKRIVSPSDSQIIQELQKQNLISKPLSSSTDDIRSREEITSAKEIASRAGVDPGRSCSPTLSLRISEMNRRTSLQSTQTPSTMNVPSTASSVLSGDMNMVVMRTGEVIKNRGYSFSQDLGTGVVLLGSPRPDISHEVRPAGLSKSLQKLAFHNQAISSITSIPKKFVRKLSRHNLTTDSDSKPEPLTPTVSLEVFPKVEDLKDTTTGLNDITGERQKTEEIILSSKIVRAVSNEDKQITVTSSVHGEDDQSEKEKEERRKSL